MICLIITGLVGCRLAARLLPNMRAIGLYAGLALVSAWHLIWAAMSGMETMIFSMWTLMLIWLAWLEIDQGEKTARGWPQYFPRGAAFGVCAGLATLTRPEGVLLVALLGLALVIVRPGMSWTHLLVYGVTAAGLWALVIAPYVVFNWQQTGGLLPNTAASKRADLAALFLSPYLVRVLDLLMPLTAGGQILLLPGIVVFVGHMVRRLPQKPTALLLLTPLLWSFGLVLLYAAYLPAFFQHGRYVMPSLPAAIVCGTAGTGMLLQQGRHSQLGRVLTRTLALAAAMVFVLFATILGLRAYTTDVEIIDSEMVRTARWMADGLDRDELLAVHDIGAVGYFASREIIDLAGLVSPELLPIIPVETNGDAAWDMLRERDARYLMGFADQLPGGIPSDPRLCPVFRARGMNAEVSDTYNMSVYRIVWNGRCEG
jgi:4-amino-4-deoxy-L-arabinose transferase-like glycosyltransferase